ncbi:MAG: hypothetical protein CSA81_08440 [Acidobacteria bacterium]|nr:MAG: hypothetical protein CSA81_08440 [Acidobacteriota bacterium]
MLLSNYFLIGIIVLSLWLYISQRLPYIVVALFTLSGLMLTGEVTTEVALSGFSSSATITIMAMFVLSEGLLKTGSLNGLSSKLIHSTRGSIQRGLFLLALIVAFASAFMNNTPVVMLMVPVVLSLCREHQFFASKLLMPLSFFAIFGGTCTVMGTSTNLLVDDIWRVSGGEGFSMFDFTPLGLVFFTVGLIYMMTIGQKLLPKKQSFSALLPESKKSSFVTEVIVTKSSPLNGRSVVEFGFKGKRIAVVEVIRGEEVYLGEEAHRMKLRESDALIIEGTVQDLTYFKSVAKTKLATVIEDRERVPIRSLEMKFAELVVPPDAMMIGLRVQTLGLNRKYGIKVIAVQRRGRQHHFDLRRFRLKAGDVLLVQSTEEDLEKVKESGEFLIVDHRIKHLQRKHKSKTAVSIMAAVVFAAVFTELPLVSLALLGAGAMISTRCLTVKEAVSAIDANVIFLLIGTIPLGEALVQAGLMEEAVEVLFSFGRELSPIWVVSLLYLLTNLATSLLSNNSVAVLFSPLALGLAAQMNLDPKPFLMAVAFGASACFISPIGYQTNLIVMGPGGYSFRDYFKAGVPLTILLWAIVTLLVPVFWPIQAL